MVIVESERGFAEAPLAFSTCNSSLVVSSSHSKPFEVLAGLKANGNLRLCEQKQPKGCVLPPLGLAPHTGSLRRSASQLIPEEGRREEPGTGGGREGG